MNTNQIITLYERHIIKNYVRNPVAIVRGQGSWVWDTDGKQYLDLFPGWGVSAVGHCHPKIVAAIREQAGRLLHAPNNYYMEPQGLFAQVLSMYASGQKCFFANSGSEANEGAIKLARLYSQPRYKIVTLKNSFHGRTFAALAATGQPSYHKGFTPLVSGFSYAKLNSLDSVHALVDEETCALMIEPVQGEGGIHPCSLEFLQGLRALCDEKNLLLIFDEVQTSPGRLGTWFGYQSFGVIPDILTSAKAIAGGMPLGVIMAKPEIAASLVPGKHGSTYGGHPVSCTAGIATFEAIEEEGMLQNVARLGRWLDKRLAKLASETGGIANVRRIGFMVGIELEFSGAEVISDCLAHGLLVNCIQGNVIRLLPAFNVTEAELDQGFDILECSLKRMEA